MLRCRKLCAFVSPLCRGKTGQNRHVSAKGRRVSTFLIGKPYEIFAAAMGEGKMLPLGQGMGVILGQIGRLRGKWRELANQNGCLIPIMAGNFNAWDTGYKEDCPC